MTSANISGEKATDKYEEVFHTFENVPDIKYIVEGSCKSDIPTTVISLVDKPKLIRQGEILFDEVLKIYKGE